MPNLEDTYSVADTADAYGRREGCFLDSQQQLFSDCLRGIQETYHNNDEESTLHQPKLRAARLPIPTIKPDGFKTSEESIDLLNAVIEPDPEIGTTEFPICSTTSLLRDLQLPLEVIDLGPDPIQDLKEYTNIVNSRLYPNALQQWLPISPTDDERDEGMCFPMETAKLRSLLVRELELERIAPCSGSLALQEEARNSLFEELGT